MELPRGTVTFLFTDIEGSTDLARRLGAEFGRVRSEHRRVLREAFGLYGGHEIDTAGDGFFVVFERAGDAVAAAVAAQRALHDLPVRVRMGIHTAEPHVHEGDYVGVGVHRAARVCAAGHGGQILVSNATAGIVEDLALEGVELAELGEHGLKDIERPQRLFQVVAEGLPSDFPPLESLESMRPHASVVTLFLTDIRGWRDVLRRLGDEGAAPVAHAYHGLVIDTVSAQSGRVLEFGGDNVLSAFDRPRDALRAAIAVRKLLRAEPWFPHDDPPGVSMAIHSGRLADQTGRHLGTVAFRCVLLCQLAEPWQILVSHATEALLEGELRDVSLRDLGEQALAEGERPVHVFEAEESA